MSMKTQQDNNVVEQLKAIVAEKEAKVHRLEDEIQQLKLNVSAYLALFWFFFNALLHSNYVFIVKTYRNLELYEVYLEWRLRKKVNIS